MTCIVGIAREGRVVIGGDSCAASGSTVTIREDPKVFQVGPFLLGCTTSYRMIQWLRYGAGPKTLDILPQPGEIPGTDDPFCYMVRLFVPAVREIFNGEGYGTKKDGAEAGGTFLVGYLGRLFRIDSDYQVGESKCGYQAAGSGEDYALGAMHATAAFGKQPATIILVALEAAAQHCCYVRPPFTLRQLE